MQPQLKTLRARHILDLGMRIRVARRVCETDIVYENIIFFEHDNELIFVVVILHLTSEKKITHLVSSTLLSLNSSFSAKLTRAAIVVAYKAKKN